ncbi:RraA family protein [Microbacterium sp.]|uniref:RraA family protein n=1 Tax=Microbacterium sp. TaxID=51671 RepID=UPI003C716726
MSSLPASGLLPPVSTISDAMGRLNPFDSRLRRRTAGLLVGRAFCVAQVVGDSATSHLAIEHAPEDSVLVIAAGGFPDRAVWGEILTAAAQRRGVRGALVDGAVRDVAEIDARAFPLFSVAVTPAGPHKSGGGSWGGQVCCAGALVSTGDLIVGDEDGVVAVPAAHADEILERAHTIVEREREILEAVGRGESTVDLLGLRPGGRARDQND